MRSTAFTELVGCEVPIQLAGMGGGTSDVGLAAAVTNAGGLGMLGAGGVPPPFVDQMLDALSAATNGPYGVNFIVPFLDRDVVAAASPRCRVVDFFYALPDATLVQVVHDAGALAAWQVGSGDEAVAAVEAGCDFVIAQGIEAGGHVRGQKPLAEVLREALDAVSVPVLASGGIGSARDVAAALDAGAAGARVGTRFLVATESIAHPEYVDSLIAASAEDTVVTETFSEDWPNAPHRVLRKCIEAAEGAEGDVVATAEIGGMEVPVARFSTMPPQKTVKGNIAAMCHYAGTSVDGVKKRQPAADIVAELCSEI
jgi:NAD(P)H-dependent flavin oxidoreductase YrpB (nitropropane dioxygenase family)